MVHTFEINADQHKTCSVCKGNETTCNTVVQCSYGPCGSYSHVDCLPQKFDRNKLTTDEYFYCKGACEDSHAPDRAFLEAKKNPAIASLISGLQNKLKLKEQEVNEVSAQRDELADAAETLNQSVLDLEEKNKKTEAELNQLMLSSTMITPNTFNNVAGTSASFYSAPTSQRLNASSSSEPPKDPGTAARTFNDSISHILDKVRHIKASRPNISANENSNAFSMLNGSTLSNEEVSQAHALASITLSLSERRKQLPKLPEFDGKGAEWLHFRNTYHALRTEGRFDDREMNAKLATALKGEALQFTRLWLYSSHPNPNKIVQDLEDRFFSPVAVVTDAFDAVMDIPLIKTKDRNALEKLKRAVDGYISIVSDVDDTPRLMIRVDEKVEDKLPDDLLEKWIRLVRNKTVRGNWHDFSHYLKEATLDLKVRVNDRVKIAASHKDVKPAKVHVISSNRSGSPPSLSSSGSSINSTSSSSSPRSPFVGKCPTCDYDLCGKYLFQCDKFAKAKHDIKIGHCQLKGLCARCLRKGHVAIDCPNGHLLPRCHVEGCTDNSSHTSIMHPPECDKRAGGITNVLMDGAKGLSLFQVASVLVQDVNGNSIPVTAFFDSGSNATLISRDLFDQLGLPGIKHDLKVEWCAGGVKHESRGTLKADLTISSAANPEEKFVLRDVVSMDGLQLPFQHQNRQEIHKIFPYLCGVDIPEFSLQRPQILLGLGHRHLMIPDQVVLPPSNEASGIAERTKLGWVVSCASVNTLSVNPIKTDHSLSAALTKMSNDVFGWCASKFSSHIAAPLSKLFSGAEHDISTLNSVVVSSDLLSYVVSKDKEEPKVLMSNDKAELSLPITRDIKIISSGQNLPRFTHSNHAKRVNTHSQVNRVTSARAERKKPSVNVLQPLDFLAHMKRIKAFSPTGGVKLRPPSSLHPRREFHVIAKLIDPS